MMPCEKHCALAFVQILQYRGDYQVRDDRQGVCTDTDRMCLFLHCNQIGDSQGSAAAWS